VAASERPATPAIKSEAAGPSTKLRIFDITFVLLYIDDVKHS
jgi:hypothetical protein